MKKITVYILRKIRSFAAIAGTILIIYFMLRTGFLFFAKYSLLDRSQYRHQK